MADQYGFKAGITDYGRALFTDQISENLRAWLRWSLLGIGAFQNITLGRQAAFAGTDLSRLRLIDDRRYPTGTVWQANRTDWCWESGVPYSAQPIQVSGVYVNGSFRPEASGGFKVNRPLGQVYFDTPLPATALVRAEYSPRYVHVEKANSAYVQALATRSMRPDEQLPTSGGQYGLAAESRFQLPAMAVEPARNGTSFPLEIGSTAGVYREDFLVHCAAETDWDRSRMFDLLRLQVDKRIPTYDVSAAPPPLDAYGRPTPSALCYPALCQQYPWGQVRVHAFHGAGSNSDGPSLYWSTARLTLEVDHA